MKRQVLAAILVVAAILSFTLGYAAPVQNIRWTPHNMSNDTGVPALARFWVTTEEQICIFCHTPHNADATAKVPLWNKVLPDNALPWDMYTSSSTLSKTSKKVKVPALESLLCLSCHDGRTATNVLHNAKSGNTTLYPGESAIDVGGGGFYEGFDNLAGMTGVGMGFVTFYGAYGKNLGIKDRAAADVDGGSAENRYYGRNLSDDHPISMSYEAVYGEKGAKDFVASPAGIRFYGGSARRVECGSCHDPHVAYGYKANGTRDASIPGDPAYRPFLRVSNTGSRLCLACHVK